MNAKTLTPLTQEQIRQIEDVLVDDIEGVLDYFGLDYHKYGKTVRLACPLHEGSNTTSLTIYLDGRSQRGNWQCQTHHCEEQHKSTLTGLIRGLLCLQSPHTFGQTLKWMKGFANINLEGTTLDKVTMEKRAFARSFKEIAPTTHLSGPNRLQVRSKLTFPAESLLKRGFNADLLDKYDIGVCTDKYRPMYNRVVVPVYDNQYQVMVGCQGRSIFDKHSCGFYHSKDTKCPQTDLEKFHCQKWINSRGFSCGKTLFNYWFAKEAILNNGYAILVEGVLDCLRLIEYNPKLPVVGLFGAKLTDEQLAILQSSGAMSLICLTDMDEAGRIAAENIKNRCKRSFRVFFPSFSGKDVGDLNSDAITSEIGGVFEEIRKFGR